MYTCIDRNGQKRHDLHHSVPFAYMCRLLRRWSSQNVKQIVFGYFLIYHLEKENDKR